MLKLSAFLLSIISAISFTVNAQTIITNTTIVDVEKQKLIPNATVLIRGNKIESINTKTITPAPGATIIDGTGKYLIPGMTDAHVHFFQSGGLYTRPDAIDLRKQRSYEDEIAFSKSNMSDVMKRNLLNGITSVIDVGATYSLLQRRKEFATDSVSPSVYMTGPLLTTFEPQIYKGLGNDRPFSLVQTEEDARKMVQEQLPYQPDFIKIWYIVIGENKEEIARKHLPIIKAVINEAHKNNLKVAVHATERITAQLSVENGADFLVHSVEDEVISNDFVKLLKEKKTILCPTLVVYDNYGKVFGQQYRFSSREFTTSNPMILGSLFDLRHLNDPVIQQYKTYIQHNTAHDKKQDSICLINLKKLSDAGVRIAAGTDAGNIGTLHGGSYLTELQKMKEAGLSNWKVLEAATISPAYFLSKEKLTGSITAGKTADMVLLDGNPVEDLNNLAKISVVVNKGTVLYPDSIIKETPLALVQRQLNAYNAKDLEAFLEPYAEDVELYTFPNKLESKGKDAMRKAYSFFSRVPGLHCEILERIVQGNTIIDKESVSGFGDKPVQATAIYQIDGNKIKRVYFIE
ncbi:amidohydrolase family protein [Pseudobacter ginsenosidimutans]|uniref:Imidazolonepropionase-like amidohydrolase n=1 Tax=Pseudobacter ginsenosidimutans TaxID=661488 RepID=A0A4Q7N516_9BACT|nr:amidohydrolase family protein [Pseudobacter ginsenosidimutans]QEC44600.1 amidohydrolase family protein [Pseudobacter ginsenosidimutans]RZS76080.1 imidazolonepropionase-like amidohydrolase [Pseudobacter ginsenosidimutans]